MDLVPILERAYRRIKKRKHWTQGTLLRDAHGFPVISADTAVSWCSIGALEAEMPERSTLIPRQALDIVSRELFGLAIVEVNDGYDSVYSERKIAHRRVCAVYEKALEHWRGRALTVDSLGGGQLGLVHLVEFNKALQDFLEADDVLAGNSTSSGDSPSG